MAKKTEEKNTSVFDDFIESEFTEIEDLSKQDDSGVDYWVDTGNYALNYAISKKFHGGYPGGRITNLYGLSGTGKSMLPAIASKAKKWDAPDLDEFDAVFLIDSEGGGTGRSLFNFVNAPINKVHYVTIGTLDSYRTDKKTGKSEAVSDKEVPAKLDTPTYIYHRGLICFLKRLIYAMEYNNLKERILIIVDSISNIKSFRAAVDGSCFTGNTLVLTKDGLKKIENIKKGELVLTHLGSYKRVEENKKFTDKNKKIILTVNGKKIETTPEHPFLTKRDGKFCWIPASELTTEDKLYKMKAY